MRRSPRFVLAAALSFELVLALGASGCAGAPEERPKIGYVLSNNTFHFAREMGAGFHAGAQIAGGVDTDVTGPPTNDVYKQIEMFKELTASAKGGIAVSASDQAMFAGPLAEASAAGIPLLVSAARPLPSSQVKLLVENDNYELGKMLAAEAIKRLPPDTAGKVVLGADIPAHPALAQRATGMRDEFVKRLPNVRVLGPFDTQREEASNLAAWQLLVAANPDAVAFLGTGDTDAANIAKVRISTKGTWLAGVCSIASQVLQNVKDGHMFAAVSPEHLLKGAMTGWLLAEHAKGTRPLPEGWLATPGLVITSSNVDEIMRRQSSDTDKQAWLRSQTQQITGSAQLVRPLDQARY
ncbi:substrate-binding domain-containing protein [Lentzea tibetensis]|uniref:Substrate-binding domain-containing protein n=1 Tax=Lentzea tibetensis TaxID=2591470 RepID=A0A563F1N4_9PSEU|nr:sugar ABC transporter substrate-binding protein [Lentzea tibetensis]TWP53829.1 substrate-binding domain-containing protein [Lentzea tibetensis]